MFWRFGGYANISTIDSLLEKPDVTVEELLEEADLIQELKSQNSKLLEFLREETVLDRLLQYVILPKLPEDELSPENAEEELDEEDNGSSNPLNSLFGKNKRRSQSKSLKDAEDESKEERQRLKYAYVACEVLSSDVWSIAEALLENRESLRRFWHYIKRDAPLDGIQASYFTKVNESLLDKKTEEMLDFFKSVDGVVADMLRHVDCPVIMDLLLKIISLERSEGGHGTIDWLQSQDLIPLLLANLSADKDAATQTSAGDFLKAIITISANATAQDSNVIGPNELTRQLVSEECVKMLITDMLRGGNPLTVGVGIIIEVIRKNNSDYDLDNQIGPIPKSSDPIYLGTLLRQFAEHIPKFMIMIKSVGTGKKELNTAFGQKIEPLGFDRFKTCELMAELLHCSNMILLNQPGSESEVMARDAERCKLKAEGKLGAYNESSTHEFGTSVDSSGFHHARAPSFGDSPEEIKRLEVSNSTEEDFEDVAAPETLVEVKDDFDEKDTPDITVPSDSKATTKDSKDTEKSEPQEEPAEQSAADAAADLSAQLEAMTVIDAPSAPDAPLHDAPPPPVPAPLRLGQKGKDDTKMSPHPEDTPAPLFSKKPRAADAEPSEEKPAESIESEPAQIDEEKEANDFPYQPDVDSKPVVGDLLKMMFVEHRVVPTILDFFFRFPWNNFLHNVVYDVVQQVFNGQMERGYNRSLACDVFDTGRITERIMEGQVASDKAQKESKMRLGYMGHLTLIAEEVVKFTERISPESLSQLVLDKVSSPEWIHYVEHTLAETRERDNAILGGVRPDANLGPRQAVLNAVNAAQGGFGSISALANLTNTAPLTLDNGSATTESDNNRSGQGYLFSGGSLISGFSHGSSDEEDEDMEEESERRTPSFIDENDQVGELSINESDL
ncbi:SAPS-domain-containing protein [Microthyrium microscopicum]|uniref:SAPS-domain-containing protein n=1 Tax=Microthyrium microscopicum TaxID=703497 RepID=A0A6A6UTM3_9PEZI|nr:SAPS-domain-containing protein [Microthyrium microscopicum]